MRVSFKDSDMFNSDELSTPPSSCTAPSASMSKSSTAPAGSRVLGTVHHQGMMQAAESILM